MPFITIQRRIGMTNSFTITTTLLWSKATPRPPAIYILWALPYSVTPRGDLLRDSCPVPRAWTVLWCQQLIVSGLMVAPLWLSVAAILVTFAKPSEWRTGKLWGNVDPTILQSIFRINLVQCYQACRQTVPVFLVGMLCQLAETSPSPVHTMEVLESGFFGSFILSIEQWSTTVPRIREAHLASALQQLRTLLIWSMSQSLTCNLLTMVLQ